MMTHMGNSFQWFFDSAEGAGALWVLKSDRPGGRRVLGFDSANGQSIKRKALLWAGYGPTSTDLHILCRMYTA